MDEEERRRRAIENLDAMNDPFRRAVIASQMLEDFRIEESASGEEVPILKHQTLYEIWRDIASVYN